MENIPTIADETPATEVLVKSITATFYMRGMATPIVVEGLKSIDWKKRDGMITSLSWEFQDNMLISVAFIKLDDIVFLKVEQLI